MVKLKNILIILGIFVVGIIIGAYVFYVQKTVYVEPTYVKNVNHGEDYNMNPEEVITGYRIICEHEFANKDLLKVDMCEECWEGVDCYKKTYDTVYITHLNAMDEGENWTIPSNAYDFCNYKVLGSGFFTITWQDLQDYKQQYNLNGREAYKRLWKEKCNINLTKFEVEITNP